MSLLARIPILRSIVPPREHMLRYNDEQDRHDVIKSRLLAIGTFVTGIGYLVWLFFALNPYHMWMGGAFLAAEVVCLLLFVTATSTVWRLRYKPPEGLPVGHPPSIDIFVTVCGEPLAVVERTLNAVAAIEWPGPRNVFVLDDGGSSEVEAKTTASGFVYRSRQRSNVSREGGKAANLNFGLVNSDSELILVLDADQVADPRILHALAGYMRFDGVGFIQSRQFYVVPNGDPFFNLDRVFYEAVQLGYDHRDNAISCGSGVLYRRAALADIGGFASWNLVEDLTTSYELHSQGWKSFYYPHAVSLGLAPAEIWGVYRQRGQWALDTMRLFFWDNPLLKRGLPCASSFLCDCRRNRGAAADSEQRVHLCCGDLGDAARDSRGRHKENVRPAVRDQVAEDRLRFAHVSSGTKSVRLRAAKSRASRRSVQLVVDAIGGRKDPRCKHRC